MVFEGKGGKKIPLLDSELRINYYPLLCVINLLSYCKLLPKTVRHKHDRNEKRRKFYYTVGFFVVRDLAINGGKFHYVVSFPWEKMYYKAILRGGTMDSRKRHYATPPYMTEMLSIMFFISTEDIVFLKGKKHS